MKRDWKIKFSILMIIAAIIIFGTNYLVLKDTHSIVSYVWLHIGFIPIDIIIVAFILEDIMSRKEKEAIYEKLDMLISTFFTEIGNELIEEFSSANEFKASTSYLKAIPNWDDAEYDKQLKKLKNANIDFNYVNADWGNTYHICTATFGESFASQTVIVKRFVMG